MARRPDPGKLLTALVALGAGLLSLSKIGDYDIWYHLRAGQLILASGLPRTDPFSFTAADRAFSVQSWLAEVIYWGAWRAGGIAGVQLFNAALVAAAFGLVALTLRLRDRSEEAWWLAGLLLAVAALGARFRLGPRPHVLEFFFLSLDLWVLQRLRARGSAPLWLLPLVQLVWVNVHASHIVGVLLPAVFLAGEAGGWLAPGLDPAEPLPLPRRRYAATLGAVLGANVLAALVNPQGWRSLTFPFALTGLETYQAHIGEWQRLTLAHLTGFSVRYTWGFSALALLGLAALAARGRRLVPVDALLFAFFLALAFRGIRLLPEFCIATLPATFAGLAPAAARLARGRARAFGWGALALVALVAAPAALADPQYDLGFGKKRIFPDDALAFAERVGVQGNVFNSFGFGDYLTFHAPDRKVFIHGRNEVFPEALYRDYLDAHSDPAVFRRLVERYRLEWILQEYTLTDYAGAEAMPHLSQASGWIPIYWDRIATLWVRADGPNAEIARRYGFRLIRPNRFDVGYLAPLLQAGLAPAVRAELEELLHRAPDNEEAWLASAFVAYAQGDRLRARADLQRAAAVNPRRAATISAAGILDLEEGRPGPARAEFERALAIQPGDPAAIEGMRQLGIAVKVPTAGLPAGHP